MARLCLATGDSVVVATESQAGWTQEEQAVGSRAMCLAADPNSPQMLYAGTEGNGVLRSTDGGRSWTQAAAFRLAHVYSIAVSPSERPRGRGAVYAGTEPSALFRSEDGGDRWVELEALQSIPSKPQWSFPPRPYSITSAASLSAPTTRRSSWPALNSAASCARLTAAGRGRITVITPITTATGWSRTRRPRGMPTRRPAEERR